MQWMPAKTVLAAKNIKSLIDKFDQKYFLKPHVKFHKSVTKTIINFAFHQNQHFQPTKQNKWN